MFDDIKIPVVIALPRLEREEVVKIVSSDEEVTKKVLFGLNNLHMVFLDHQYQF